MARRRASSNSRRRRNVGNSRRSTNNRNRGNRGTANLGSLVYAPSTWKSTSISGIIQVNASNALTDSPFSGNTALTTLLTQSGEYRLKRCTAVWNPLTASTASGSLGLYIYFDEVNKPSDLVQLVSAGVTFRPSTSQQRVSLQYTSDTQAGSQTAEGGIVYWWANGTSHSGTVGLIHYVVEIEQRALRPTSSITVGTAFDGN